MPTERKCRERERAAYTHGFIEGGQFSQEVTYTDAELRQEAESRLREYRYPLPPAEVCRCAACGQTSFASYDTRMINGSIYHWGSNAQKWCGPIEEVEG